MNGKKQLAINMIANIVNLLANLGISFFLSPIIVAKLGAESYGFVTLANNFVNYISLITIALNSVSGRFITIKIHQKDYEKANMYYNSVLVTNIIFCIILFVPSVIFIHNLEMFLNISLGIVWNVKILFSLVFVSFYISIIGNVYSVATFAKNRLELSAARNTILNVFKVIVLICAFTMFSPNIIWMGAVSLLVAVLTIITNINYSKKLLPELKLNIKEFKISAVKELLISGYWNTISQVGQILLNGLDILLTNLFISPQLMGVVSISKTIPDILGSVAGTLVSAFSPSFTILYAKGKNEELLQEIKQSIKITGLILGIPIGGWLAFGQDFFNLWMPTENSKLLYQLSVLASLTLFVNGGVSCIYNIFAVTNKLKVNSISLLCSGGINALIVFILLKTTNLGVYAVVGTSTIILIFRNLLVSIPYAAKVCLGQKWYYFYGDVLKTTMSILGVYIIGICVKKVILINTWGNLIFSGCVVVLVSIIVEYFVALNKKERQMCKNFFEQKILKKNRKQ